MCSGPLSRTWLQVLRFIHETLDPALQQTGDEIDHIMRALAGGFVPPGPSGAPTRGSASILPTGRNFYSVDVKTIPSPAAWDVGRRLGDGLLAALLARGRGLSAIGRHRGLGHRHHAHAGG